MLHGKTIVLGITGGIAAYKAATLCSKLTQAGASVHVIMTDSATKFIPELTLQTLSRNPVYTDTFDERDPAVVSHIHLADRADLFLIAPATANILAKMAYGLADDMLSTTLLATTAPVMVAPAMNVHMYAHPAVQHNMELLRQRGVHFIEPAEGPLACGYTGKGRLEEPELIIEHVRQFFEGANLQSSPQLVGSQGNNVSAAASASIANTHSNLLVGRRVMVTAGGTLERIDPVRYLTNDASGKMGIAIAEAARDMGADVTLIAGQVQTMLPEGVNIIRVESAADMLNAVQAHYDKTDIVVKAAAVADYRPKFRAEQKIKKTAESLVLELERNTDILAWLGEHKHHQVLVGFAAETEKVAEFAQDKLKRKGCDLIVANDVSRSDIGFGSDNNEVLIFDGQGLVESVSVRAKQDVAKRVLAQAAKLLPEEVLVID
ncbi:bifunctional phosphopantothenoylcysteine decarboxylase/phosphopantothenate--cysteine ligase CoaBC [Paenibacillus sp. SC116]|uniref:bifunctional phosphopantothenoylcysteine decarboxylase/phosphopantothenate--cysteine ligase CoaBC n=1 Tax=Paenibacillus sp. SC116 TaxID=2968986 RepID=UPI00215A0EA2|nr:bifunctional phosphopantothenoylcysteine decarboxylase/phosphopantothenate--cysteine ligase CoaBC [Paenibacillus sp. SC116]MCR8845258.1 bifunctional phosphopantothenoylcysteine decarboxylase/phosphopantothenate--cysteine ligase CoaBC [Paenibacillus sp. SC116]